MKKYCIDCGKVVIRDKFPPGWKLCVLCGVKRSIERTKRAREASKKRKAYLAELRRKANEKAPE